MISFASIIFMVIGILLIFVYPQIIRWAIILFLLYLTIFYSWYFSIIFIPLLLIIYFYKRRKRNGI